MVLKVSKWYRSRSVENNEDNPNKSLVESGNEMGLKEDLGNNVPRMDNADEANVIVEVCENTCKPKITHADMVKGMTKG